MVKVLINIFTLEGIIEKKKFYLFSGLMISLPGQI